MCSRHSSQPPRRRQRVCNRCATRRATTLRRDASSRQLRRDLVQSFQSISRSEPTEQRVVAAPMALMAQDATSRQLLRGRVQSFQSISRSEVHFHLDSAINTIVLSARSRIHDIGPESDPSCLLETPPLRVHLNVGHTVEVDVANIHDASIMLEAISFRNVTPAALRKRNRKPSVLAGGMNGSVAASGSDAISATAAAGAMSVTSRRPPCRNWARLGACDRANCQFTHLVSNAFLPATSAVTIVGAAESEQEADVNVAGRVDPSMAAASTPASDSIDSDAHAHGGDECESHSRRAVIFAAWIVASFGLDRLQQGTGVLDIAGGKGALAFALSRYGIAATVIDPRPSDKVNLSRLQKKHYRKNPSAVRHSHIHDVFSRAAVRASERMLELVQGCSLIVGLHPDQATDSIVEVALEFGKPFAVVPCCVFPKLFPHRRIVCDSSASGGSCETRPVLNRADLCEYLWAKCPESASIVRLRMSGANHVVSSRRASEGDARSEEFLVGCAAAASVSVSSALAGLE